jgi:hypothetical protein
MYCFFALGSLSTGVAFESIYIQSLSVLELAIEAASGMLPKHAKLAFWTKLLLILASCHGGCMFPFN